jgi:hypothetical protein
MAVVLSRLHPIRTYGRATQTDAFAIRGPTRPLRIAIDRSSAPAGPALDLVLELAAAGHAELWSTEDEGVDATVNIGVGPSADNSIPVCIQHRDGRQTLLGIWPKAQWERHIEQHVTTTGQPRAIVEPRFLAAAALMDRVDALVVGDLDFGHASGLASHANPMSPEGACALIGLVARLKDDFTVARVSRSFFHFLVARALLPAGWRWFSACVASSHATTDDFVLNVGQSGHERLARAFVSRDRCLGHDLGGHGSSAADEVAYYFDVELLMLSSALDAVAHVAHVAHSVDEDVRSVGWRRGRWRHALKKVAPPLWGMTEYETPERDAIELVALLRNTIHGAGMQQIAVGGTGSIGNQLAISANVAEELLPIVDRHGGASAWGLTPGPYPRLVPAPFAQRIVPLVARAMNTLMSATEVDRLLGVNASTLLSEPPITQDLFRPDLTERLLLLAGLAP